MNVKTLTKWTLLGVVLSTFSLTPAQAWWGRRRAARPNTPWERIADQDGDGRVEPVELRAHQLRLMDADRDGEISATERHSYWADWKGMVSTEVERRYDTNGDGYIEWVEAQPLLQERLRIVATKGRAGVDADVEREFDEDCNGVIDRTEAEAIREALAK